MNKLLSLLILFIIFISNNQAAKELLIYADSISYDKEENIIAKGNVKIISQNEIIRSELIIVKKKDNKIMFFWSELDFFCKNWGWEIANRSDSFFWLDLNEKEASTSSLELLFNAKDVSINGSPGK